MSSHGPAENSEHFQALNYALDIEGNAAKIIQILACRLDQNSELATQARLYAARLRFNIERINGLLPQNARISSEPTVGTLPELIIYSMSSDKAAAVLERFLLDRVEAPAFSAQAYIGIKGIDQICGKLLREQRRISDWVANYRLRRELSSVMTNEGQPRPSRRKGNFARERDVAQSESSGSGDDPSRAHALDASHIGVLRINDHSSSQIVRWL